MNIIPRISVKAVQESGSTTQQATANYFDKNGNGILELEESDRFQKAKIEKTDKAIKIINADGSVDIFENMSIEHDEEYYSSGTIPVAVIDMFDTTAGNGWHGKHVCNMMKSVNPDISITKFDNSPTKTYNKFQMAVYNLISKNPKLDKFCSKHQPFKSIVNNILEDGQQTDAVEKCFDEVIQQMNNGKKFQAVNLSASQDCSYPEINRLVGNELGVEITPENIAKYKKQIKEVLETKQNKKFDSVGDPVKIKQTLDIIHKIFFDYLAIFFHRHQVIGSLPLGIIRLLQIHLAARDQKFPASSGVFDMDAELLAIKLNVGNEAVGAGYELGGSDVLIFHICTNSCDVDESVSLMYD